MILHVKKNNEFNFYYWFDLLFFDFSFYYYIIFNIRQLANADILFIFVANSMACVVVHTWFKYRVVFELMGDEVNYWNIFIELSVPPHFFFGFCDKYTLKVMRIT